MAKNLLIMVVLALFVGSAVWLGKKNSDSQESSPSPSATESVSPTPSVTPSPTLSASPSTVSSGPNGLRPTATPTLKVGKLVTLANGLGIEEVKIGIGAEAKSGNTVTVNYVGTLANGQKFDSSYDRKQPFTFKLGAREVIDGWDIGVAGMKVGGKRKLVIPPDLAYGKGGISGVIPPDATLFFEVELLSVTK